MKNRIIEICELGQPQSIIHRENQPITELIKTDSLIEELNQQLRLHVVSNSSKPKKSKKEKRKLHFGEWKQSKGFRYMSGHTYKDSDGDLYDADEVDKMYQTYYDSF